MTSKQQHDGIEQVKLFLDRQAPKVVKAIIEANQVPEEKYRTDNVDFSEVEFGKQTPHIEKHQLCRRGRQTPQGTSFVEPLQVGPRQVFLPDQYRSNQEARYYEEDMDTEHPDRFRQAL